MKKEHTALPVAASLLIVTSITAFGNETSVERKRLPEKDFVPYLPALPPHAPWLQLDARPKLPKGDYPLGREAESIGRLTARAHTQPIFERRM
jgi:hypothetical protein